MKVFVYRNLHKPGYTYSIKALDGIYKNTVVGYASILTLSDVTFKVSAAGQRRCRRERLKNVHAGLIGNLTAACDWTSRVDVDVNKTINWLFPVDATMVSYNPYKNVSFVKRNTSNPILHADAVQVWGDQVWAYGNITA